MTNQCFCGQCAICRIQERNRIRNAAAVGCRCGNAKCDCARWERIYREKFEDPSYYDVRKREQGHPYSLQCCLKGLTPAVDPAGGSITREVSGDRDVMRRQVAAAARDGLKRKLMRAAT